jgi:hypothetical protein
MSGYVVCVDMWIQWFWILWFGGLIYGMGGFFILFKFTAI